MEHLGFGQKWRN
jgi:hypothetical protein